MASQLATSATYRRLTAVVRFCLGVFFRRIEVAGARNVPHEGGGILVSWHPNGVVDPALILTHCPQPVVFGARDGLFKIPGFGRLVKALGTVPIYRAEDAAKGGDLEARRAANARSLDALAQAVHEGNFAALFPEGVSHDGSKLRELRTGAARLYYRACNLARDSSAAPPVLVPVGLHYDRKSVFRSSAFVRFHEALIVPPELAPEVVSALPPEGQRDAHRDLTKLIEVSLTEKVHATESWQLHSLMERARSLIRAERALRSGVKLGRAEIAEQSRGFSRVWRAYMVRAETHPEETHALMQRLHSYDRKLVALSLKDAELDHPPKLWLSYGPTVLAVQLLCLYLLVPPVLFFGFAINGPPYLLLKLFVARAAEKRKDEASIKIVGGTVLFLGTWLLAAALSTVGQVNLHEHFAGIPRVPILTFLTVFTLCILGALGALHHKVVMAQTWRALTVRVTRRRQSLVIKALKDERAALHDGLIDLAQGLALPFEASASGVVGEGKE